MGSGETAAPRRGEAGSGETVARRWRDGSEEEKRVVNWGRKISGGNQAARGVR